MKLKTTSLAERVRTLRSEAGWTQSALAESARLGASTISRVETGYRVSTETLIALADALGCELTELVQLTEHAEFRERPAAFAALEARTTRSTNEAPFQNVEPDINLRLLRKKRNMSQVQLAEAANISLSTVARLERGGAPNLSTLSRVAEALDVELGALLQRPAVIGEFSATIARDAFSDIAEMFSLIDLAIRVTRVFVLWSPPRPWMSAAENVAEYNADPITSEERRIRRLEVEIGIRREGMPLPIESDKLGLWPLRYGIDPYWINRIVALEQDLVQGNRDDFAASRKLVTLSFAQKNSPLWIGVTVLAAAPWLNPAIAHVACLTKSVMDFIVACVSERREHNRERRQLLVEGQRQAVREQSARADFLEIVTANAAQADLRNPEFLGPTAAALAGVAPPIATKLDQLEVSLEAGPVKMGAKG